MMARRKQIAAAQAKNLCIFIFSVSLLPLHLRHYSIWTGGWEPPAPIWQGGD